MTTITSQAPAIQFGSPELEELLERIATGEPEATFACVLSVIAGEL